MTDPSLQHAAEPAIEPWMRGPIAGVDPMVAPLLYSFQMAREDLALHSATLSQEGSERGEIAGYDAPGSDVN